MYSILIRSGLDEKFKKIKRKYPKQFDIIMKKTDEIVQNPYHYKSLHAPMNHLRRVHIDRHFVLIFSIDEENKSVILEDFDHHDNVYRH